MATNIVYEIMTSDVITTSKNTGLDEVIEKLATSSISSIVVVENNIPVGIVSERDITRLVSFSKDIYKVKVSEFMSPNPVTIYRNADIVMALEKMERHGIRRLIVVDKQGRLNGIITYSDIIRKLEESFFKVHTSIETVMTQNILKIHQDASLKEAIDFMAHEKKSCLLVVSDKLSNDINSLVGIITERDIVKVLYKKLPLDISVRDICTKNIIYTNYDTILYDAIKIMNERNIRHMVVISEGFQLKGIVTQTDVINMLNENLRKGIKEQYQRLRESLDALKTGFIEFELNEEGTILYISRHGSHILGFENVDNAIGFSFVNLLSDKRQWQEFLQRANRSSVINFTFNTRERVIEGSFNIRKFSARGIFKDITEDFIERETIKKQKNRFENILKTLSEGLIIYNKNGDIKEVNQAALNILGMTKDELIGKTFHSLNNIMLADEKGNFYKVKRSTDGDYRWFIANITPIFDEENKLLEIVQILTDITDIYMLEQRTNRILETAREGYWEVDLDGRIKKINMALSNLLGYSMEEMLSKSIYDIVDEENRYIFEEALKRREKGISDSYEITLKNKNGDNVYVIVSASPLIDTTGKVFGASAFITDITELKSAHDVLHSIASFYKDISQALNETETYQILQHYLLSLNKGGAKINAIYLVNIDPNKRTINDLISYNDSGFEEKNKFPGLDKCKCYTYNRPFLIQDLSRDYPCPYQRFAVKRGSYYCVPMSTGGVTSGILHLYSISPNFFSKQIKEVIDNFITLFASVVNSMRLLEINKNLALIDPLTGLYNRRYFEEFMEKQLAIAERNNQPLSMIILDLDNFKNFNDTYGHDAGDMALKTIAHTINKNIRASDIGVRYGGEEFIIVLPNTGKKNAFEVAERIRNSIEINKIPVFRDKKIAITASLGIATYGIDADSIETLIAKADNALYNAKKSGKNKVFMA